MEKTRRRTFRTYGNCETAKTRRHFLVYSFNYAPTFCDYPHMFNLAHIRKKINSDFRDFRSFRKKIIGIFLSFFSAAHIRRKKEFFFAVKFIFFLTFLFFSMFFYEFFMSFL
jgi:hypothetical protein